MTEEEENTGPFMLQLMNGIQTIYNSTIRGLINKRYCMLASMPKAR